MIRFAVLVICAWTAYAAPQFINRSKRPVPVFRETTSVLKLPDNATLIRENIVDTFSCQNRIYGYYADVENECQIFHVCLPQNNSAMRWSFICPTNTVFNQATFVCTWTDDSIPCTESERYYELNQEFGKDEEEESQRPEDVTQNPSGAYPINNELPVTPFYGNSRGRGREQRRGKSNDVTEIPELTDEKIQLS